MGNMNKSLSTSSSKDVIEVLDYYNKLDRTGKETYRKKERLSIISNRSCFKNMLITNNNETNTKESNDSLRNKLNLINKFTIELNNHLITPNFEKKDKENILIYYPLLISSIDEPYNSKLESCDFRNLKLEYNTSEYFFINTTQMIKLKSILVNLQILSVDKMKIRDIITISVDKFLHYSKINLEKDKTKGFPAYSPIYVGDYKENKNSNEPTISKIDITMPAIDTDRDDQDHLYLDDEFNLSNFIQKEADRVVKERGPVIKQPIKINQFKESANKNQTKQKVINGHSFTQIPSFQKPQIKIFQNIQNNKKTNNTKPTFYKYLDYNTFVNERKKNETFKKHKNKPLSSSTSRIYTSTGGNNSSSKIRKDSYSKQNINLSKNNNEKSNFRSKSIENFKRMTTKSKVNGQSFPISKSASKLKVDAKTQKNKILYKKSSTHNLNTPTSQSTLNKIAPFKIDIRDFMNDDDEDKIYDPPVCISRDYNENLLNNEKELNLSHKKINKKHNNFTSIPEVDQSASLARNSDVFLPEIRNRLSTKKDLFSKKSEMNLDELIMKDDVNN